MVKPLARRRARQTLDTSAMAAAVARPGIDPRTWIALGRVTEVGFDNGLVAAVMITEGALMGEEVACDVLSPFASVLATASAPIEVGDTVLIACLQGDANTMPIVLGALHTGSTRAPVAINGRKLDAALAGGNLLLSNEAADAEIAVKNLRITAETTRLGPSANPTQPFVRGQAFADALSDFLEAQLKFAAALTTAIGAAVPAEAGFKSLAAAVAPWTKAMVALEVHLASDALSKTIKGE